MQPSVAAAAAWAHLPGAIAANLLPLMLLAVAYCTLLIRPLSPGAPKLLLSLPVIALFFLAPLGFDAVSVAGNIGFVLSWLSNFKLLAASGGRGPLAMHGISAAQYAALLVFPFYNAKPGQVAVKMNAGWMARFAFKTTLFAAVTLYLSESNLGEGLPLWLKHQIYALYIWLLIGMTLDPFAPALVPILGQPLQAGMDQPFLAGSIREFWGCRWNQVVSCTLRDVVYLPVLRGSWASRQTPAGPQAAMGQATGSQGKGQAQGQRQEEVDVVADARGRSDSGKSSAAGAGTSGSPGPGATGSRRSGPRFERGRQLLALCAAFVVSGCMHELMNYYMCHRTSWQWRTLLFFLLQPPLIVAQELLFSLVPPKTKASLAFKAFATISTLLTVSASAEFTFWEHFESCGTDRKGVGEMMQLGQSIVAQLSQRLELLQGSAAA